MGWITTLSIASEYWTYLLPVGWVALDWRQGDEKAHLPRYCNPCGGWCQRRELNPRPKAYESSALPLSYSGNDAVPHSGVNFATPDYSDASSETARNARFAEMARISEPV